MNNSLTNFIDANNLMIIKSFKGHKQKYGKSAGKERNSYHLVKNKNNTTEEYYIMEYEKKNKDNEYFKFDINSLEKVQKVFDKINPTWYQSGNGYIATHISINKKKTCIHLHQYLMDYYGQNSTLLSSKCTTNTEKGISVDHINRCRTDNRISNLRLATQSEQNYNQVRKRGTNMTVEKVSKLNINTSSTDTEEQATSSANTEELNEKKKIKIENIKSLIPKYIGYRYPAKEKSGGNHGEHFAIEMKKKELNGKTTRIRKKTTKSEKYSLVWKLILAIKIRHKLIKENDWIQRNLEIDNNDELLDFIDEEKELIKQLAKFDNLQITPALLDMDDITSMPKYKLAKVECPYCGKKIAKESLTRHIKLMKHKTDIAT